MYFIPGNDSPCKQNKTNFHRSLSCSDSELHSLKTNKTGGKNGHISLRHSNFHSSVANRKRVIKMLVVVVMEYFICWTPLYVLNTWKIVSYETIHNKVSYLGWNTVLLLAYSSSFIHPITYCFLNKNFRKGFVTVFKCFVSKKSLGRPCTEFSSVPTTQIQLTTVPNTPRLKHRLDEDYNDSDISPED